MRLRWKVLLVCVGLMTGLLTYALTCTALSAWVFGLGRGDRGFAEKWYHRLQTLPDLETAQAAYPEIEGKRFQNGEWVFGVSADSHGSYWGGTIVVKDSTGRIRVFFGHVCGRRRLESAIFQRVESLQAFDDHPEWETFEIGRASCRERV